MTEYELADGLLNAVDPNRHTLCLVRHFSGMDDKVAADDKTASRFIEIINKHGQVSAAYKHPGTLHVTLGI